MSIAKPVASSVASSVARSLASYSSGGVAAPLLDSLPPAAAAYSLRRLSTAYGAGACIRVRRASDNVEANIVFNGNFLDTANLLTFCSGTDAYVVTWFDQSGNGVNKTQSASAAQPQIVSAGSLITFAGKPSVYFPESTGLTPTATTYIGANPLSVFLLASSASASTAERRCLQANLNNYVFGPYQGLHSWFSGDWNHQVSPAWSEVNFEQFSFFQPLTDAVESYRNGAVVSSANNKSTINGLCIGIGASSDSFLGYVSELIEFTTDQRAIRSSIEASQKAYWGSL